MRISNIASTVYNYTSKESVKPSEVVSNDPRSSDAINENHQFEVIYERAQENDMTKHLAHQQSS